MGTPQSGFRVSAPRWKGRRKTEEMERSTERQNNNRCVEGCGPAASERQCTAASFLFVLKPRYPINRHTSLMRITLCQRCRSGCSTCFDICLCAVNAHVRFTHACLHVRSTWITSLAAAMFAHDLGRARCVTIVLYSTLTLVAA